MRSFISLFSHFPKEQVLIFYAILGVCVCVFFSLSIFFYSVSPVNKDPLANNMLLWSGCTYIKWLSRCQNVFTKVSSERAVSLCLLSDSSSRVYPLRQEFLWKGVLFGATRSAVRGEGRKQEESSISLTPGEHWELSHFEAKWPSLVALYQAASGCRGPPEGGERGITSQTFPGNMTFGKIRLFFLKRKLLL